MALWLSTALGLGCAASRPIPTGPPVTVVVDAPGELSPQLRSALQAADVPVEVRVAELPALPALEMPRLGFEERLASAREHYIAADFDACQRELQGEGLETALLGDNRRTTASRVLLWRIACHVGAAQTEPAQRVALRFAVYDLEVPQDVEAVTPEVEALLGRSLGDVGQQARATLALRSEPSRAAVAIDGRPAACSTPCELDLPPGEHVVRLHTAGTQPVVRRLRLPSTGHTLHAELPAAAPVVVARQWATRYAGSPAIDSADSVRLLARAVRAQRLVLVTADGDDAIRLRGVLAIEDRISARTERDTAREDLPRETSALLRDLLVQGEVVAPSKPLVRRWGFWLAIGLTAAGAATVTALVLDRDPPRTEVRFQ